MIINSLIYQWLVQTIAARRSFMTNCYVHFMIIHVVIMDFLLFIDFITFKFVYYNEFI